MKFNWTGPGRPLAVLLSFHGSLTHGVSTVHAAMVKHVVHPAVAEGPLPRRAEHADLVPLVVENVEDELVVRLGDLALPSEELQDGTGVVEAEGPADDQPSTSSEEEGEELVFPAECSKCQRSMREANRTCCPSCGNWFHSRRVSISSNGKCRFCP